MEMLCRGVLGGGLGEARSILNHQVPLDFNDPNPRLYLERVASSLGLPRPVVGLMTAADVSRACHRGAWAGGAAIDVVVTAGASNATSIREEAPFRVGTVNVVVVVDANLAPPCMVELVSVAGKAVAEAFRELDVRGPRGGPACGTTTDSFIVACTRRGVEVPYGGMATELGRAVALCVVEAVKEALVRSEGLSPDRPLIRRLEERGVTFNDLIEAAMEVLIPEVGGLDEVREALATCLEEALNDVNVASLVMAGLRLEEDGARGLIPGLKAGELREGPVRLLADEVIGMEVARYIAGTKGAFEFIRLDRAKPGVLKRLGPFAEDVIGGLIAGASSNAYSRLLAGRRGLEGSKRA
ncbi:hypothetical protein B6U99_06735 [Candidatus Geothermarchaeota archaeon ex4572_27]|nr:MAG: hypothetical protein B6U99_06735 [Candidatus Geothermarchaeota archaeon ex4572_27]